MKSNLKILGFIHIFREFLLFLPVLTLFWIGKGLSMTDIFLLQSIFAAVMVISEVPSGYFADKFGQKRSIWIGSFLYFLGIFGYIFAGNFWDFLLPEVLLGIGRSLISGADSAILFKSLKKLKRENEYKRWEGKYFSYGSYSIAIAGIIGAFLWEYDQNVLMWSTAAVLFLPVILSYFLVEVDNDNSSKNNSSKNYQKSEWQNIKEILRYVFIKQKIFWGIFIFGTAISLGSWASVWYSQPLWKSVDIPVTYFGIIWAIFMVIKGLVARFSHELESRVGILGSFGIILGLLIGGYIFLAIFSEKIWGILFLIPILATHGLVTPILRDTIQQNSSDNRRATLISIQSLFTRLSTILIGPWFGYVLDLYSFQVAFYFTAGFCLVFGIMGIFIYQKNNQKI